MCMEQAKLQNKNLKNMLEEEKKMFSEYMEKWRVRIGKLQDNHKGGFGYSLQTKYAMT